MSFSRKTSFLSVTALATQLLLGGGMPAMAATPDHRIEAAARNSYNFKTYLKDDAVKVASAKGVVTLSGTVATDFHKGLAEQTVAQLPGVVSVTNDITLAGAQPTPASDDWISLKVRSALAFHKNVSVTATKVHTQGGVVTLSGVAANPAERDLAGEYAKDVEGVTEVRNTMTVGDPGPRPKETLGEKIDDTSITAQIKTTLLFHKSVRTLATKVITKDGHVSLHGEAKTQAEKDKVTRLAEDIKGVKGVNNHMTVAHS